MPADGTAAKAPVRSDDEIRNSVLMELKWDPKITSIDIGVALKDGVVTLAGFVSSESSEMMISGRAPASRRAVTLSASVPPVEMMSSTIKQDRFDTSPMTWVTLVSVPLFTLLVKRHQSCAIDRWRARALPR